VGFQVHCNRSVLCLNGGGDRTGGQLPPVLMLVTGGSSKGIRPKLLQCASKSSILVPWYLSSHVQAIEQLSQ